MGRRPTGTFWRSLPIAAWRVRIVARAGYTIGATRSLMLESVVRQNGDGVYGKAEYSHGLGQHWRVAVRMLVITGDETDFLGQYRRNSFGGQHGSLQLLNPQAFGGHSGDP